MTTLIPRSGFKSHSSHVDATLDRTTYNDYLCLAASNNVDKNSKKPARALDHRKFLSMCRFFHAQSSVIGSLQWKVCGSSDMCLTLSGDSRMNMNCKDNLEEKKGWNRSLNLEIWLKIPCLGFLLLKRENSAALHVVESKRRLRPFWVCMLFLPQNKVQYARIPFLGEQLICDSQTVTSEWFSYLKIWIAFGTTEISFYSLHFFLSFVLPISRRIFVCMRNNSPACLAIKNRIQRIIFNVSQTARFLAKSLY